MGTLFDEAESAPTALTWRIWTRNVALTHSSFETAASDNPADRFAVGPGGFDRNAIERVVPQDEALGFAYAIALGSNREARRYPPGDDASQAAKTPCHGAFSTASAGLSAR